MTTQTLFACVHVCFSANYKHVDMSNSTTHKQTLAKRPQCTTTSLDAKIRPHLLAKPSTVCPAHICPARLRARWKALRTELWLDVKQLAARSARPL
jgi:hypothetical protein